MLPVLLPHGGRGRGVQAQNFNSSHPVGYSEYRVLVKHNLSSQGLPGTETVDSLAASGNVYGAIGGQRSNRRSVSLSSNSSITSPESADSQSQANVEEDLHHGHLASSGCDPLQDNKDAKAKSLGIGASLPLADVELKGLNNEPIEEYGVNSSCTPCPSGVSVQAQPSLGAAKLGRPITKQSDSALSTSLVAEINITDMLRNPVCSTRNFTPSVNQDLKMIDSSCAYTDPTISANVASTADHSNHLEMSFLSSQPGLFHQDSSQFSQNPTAGNQGGYNTANAGSYLYSFQGFIATHESYREAAKHCTSGHPGEYFTSFRNFLANGSQDLSVPPPGGVPMTATPTPACVLPMTGSLLPSGVSSLTSTPHASQTQQPRLAISVSMKKIITCNECQKTHKWPHTLHCLHVFCFPCLTAHFDPADQSITCGQCTMKTSLTDGPCSLKMDCHATRMMLKLNMSPFNCTACSRFQDAVVCCKTCMAYLCHPCLDGHQNMKHFLYHNVVPITKLREIADGVHTSLCDLHPSELMVNYCSVCSHMICAACLPDHDHPGYPKGCSTLAEAFPIVADRLSLCKDDADAKAENMSAIAQKFKKFKQEKEQKSKRVFKELDQYVTYVITVAHENQWNTKKSLEFALNNYDKDSQALVYNALKASDEMKTFKEFTSRTVNYNAPEDTLMLLDIMEDAYKRAIINCSKVTEESKRIQCEVKFDPNYKETHDILNQNFACVNYPSNPDVPIANLLTDFEGSRESLDFTNPSGYYNFNYQSLSTTSETTQISTWNPVSDRERHNGTYIPQLNRCRIKTSYIRTFGELGAGEYSFTEPSGPAYMKDGSFLICDTNNHRIVHYSANHEYLRTIGQRPFVVDKQENRTRGKMFTRQNGYLFFPNRVAICPITQNIIATERTPSHDIQMFSHDGHFLRCFGGNILQHPRGVAVDEEGIIIVIECRIMKLVMFKQDGSLIVSHSLNQDVQFPNDIAVKDKNILISDNRGHCIHVFNYNAEFLYKIGGEHVTYFPVGVSINHLGQVVVANNHNTFNITVFDMSGTVLHTFESVTKLAQCLNTAIHPSRLELMVSTKTCNIYFFSYDPEGTHALKPPDNYRSGNAVSRAIFRR